MSNKNRSDGEGSLYQLHDPHCERPAKGCRCKWKGAIVLGYRDKRAIRKTVTAATRSACAGKLDDLKALHKAGDLPASGKPITVEQWMNHWLGQIVPRKSKPSTIETYTTNVKQYINPLLGHHRLDRLTPELIDDAWDVLLDDGNPLVPPARRKPLSANSVHLAHRVLARALKVAIQRKRLRVNPAGSDSMDAPPRIEKEVEPIPGADVEKILEAAKGTPYGARWSVALSLGLRPGEALGLRWEDVDLATGELWVRQQLQRQKGRGLVTTTPKSEKGKRVMRLPATMLADLKAHKKAQAAARLLAGDHWTDSGLVFTQANGKPIDGKTDRNRWHALLDDAGVTQRRLYDARHSAATMMLKQGIPMRVVMDLLGHSQISVTAKYQHPDELKDDAAARMEAGLWG